MTPDELTHSIYRAAENPSQCNRVVDGIVGSIGAQLGVLFYSSASLPAGSGEFETVSVHRFSPTSVEAYLSYFGARDIRVAAGQSLRVGDLYVDDQTLPFRDVVASEIYHDFYRPLGLGHCMAVVLFRKTDRVGVLSAHRAADRGAFTVREGDRFKAIGAHVVRALQWQRQLGQARDAAGAMATALDRFTTAVFLIAQDQTLVHANAAAMTLLARTGCALRLDRGRLTAVAKVAVPALAASVAQASKARQGASTPPPVLRLPDTDGTLALLVITPSDGDAVLIFATHSSDRLAADPVVLQQAFGLLRSEADVVLLLAAGHAPEAISERRGASIATVRTQTKYAMQKLGVRRQSELVGLVARSLAALRPNQRR